MNIAYEHVRTAPDGDLTRQLITDSITDILGEHFPNLEGNINNSTNLVSDVFGSESETPVEDALPLIGAPPVNSMLTTSTHDSRHQDVGQISPVVGPLPNEALQSNIQDVLQDMHCIVASEQVPKRPIEFALSWIIERAERVVLMNNSEAAYTRVPENMVKTSGNVIGSHFVDKIKQEEKGMKRLKARLCQHGHRDSERSNIRNDSSSILFVRIRLILSICVMLHKRIGLIDIKGAYL